jgi:hypothetical protein
VTAGGPPLDGLTPEQRVAVANLWARARTNTEMDVIAAGARALAGGGLIPLLPPRKKAGTGRKKADGQ